MHRAHEICFSCARLFVSDNMQCNILTQLVSLRIMKKVRECAVYTVKSTKM